MTDIDVLSVTRESVTLAWQPVAAATSYYVRRRVVVRGVPGEDEALAVVFRCLFADVGLRAGSEYVYEVSAVPPEEPPLDWQEVTLRCRLRTAPPTEYESMAAFVERFIAPTWRRVLSPRSARWCPEWWRHPEANYVLTELWHAYEALRPPDHPDAFPTKARADWLVAYAYPLLAHLFSSEGTFQSCALNERERPDGQRHTPLPVTETQPLPVTPDLTGNYRPGD